MVEHGELTGGENTERCLNLSQWRRVLQCCWCCGVTIADMEAYLAACLAMLALDGHRLSYVRRRSYMTLSQGRSCLPHLWLLSCCLVLWQRCPCHTTDPEGLNNRSCFAGTLRKWQADMITGWWWSMSHGIVWHQATVWQSKVERVTTKSVMTSWQ